MGNNCKYLHYVGLLSHVIVSEDGHRDGTHSLIRRRYTLTLTISRLYIYGLANIEHRDASDALRDSHVVEKLFVKLRNS